MAGESGVGGFDLRFKLMGDYRLFRCEDGFRAGQVDVECDLLVTGGGAGQS
jgi:hypothetical protein